MVSEEDRFKFVDDLSILEIINLLITEISTYNIKAHVPSDIPLHNKFIKNKNMKSSQNLNLINQWTKSKKMLLNKKKTKTMIFNFTRNHQFTTRMVEDNVNIEVVHEFKLLGTWITSDLSWNKNTTYITKRAYGRLQLLHKAAKFTKSKRDLKNIYTTFIRPVLEQSSIVWHSGLTDDNVKDIERVQKAAVRVIMGSDFTDYQHALSELKITNLSERRRELSKKFALKIANNLKMQHMLPLRTEMRENKRRHTDKYRIQHANTHRLQASAIPYMQKQLNQHNKEEQDWCNIED